MYILSLRLGEATIPSYISSSSWHLSQAVKCVVVEAPALLHGGGHSTSSGLGSARQRAPAGFRITAAREDCLGVLRVLTVQPLGNPQNPTTYKHRNDVLALGYLNVRNPLKQAAHDHLRKPSNPTRRRRREFASSGPLRFPPEPPNFTLTSTYLPKETKSSRIRR